MRVGKSLGFITTDGLGHTTVPITMPKSILRSIVLAS
jgi:hypothetical protein